LGFLILSDAEAAADGREIDYLFANIIKVTGPDSRVLRQVHTLNMDMECAPPEVLFGNGNHEISIERLPGIRHIIIRNMSSFTRTDADGLLELASTRAQAGTPLVCVEFINCFSPLERFARRLAIHSVDSVLWEGNVVEAMSGSELSLEEKNDLQYRL
jgi:hypothetical protein